MKNEAFWKFMMAGSVAGWGFALFGLLFPFEPGAVRTLWWVILLGWGILHPLELQFSLPIGKEKGVALERTIANTLIFGFTWWLPLKLGAIER